MRFQTNRDVVAVWVTVSAFVLPGAPGSSTDTDMEISPANCEPSIAPPVEPVAEPGGRTNPPSDRATNVQRDEARVTATPASPVGEPRLLPCVVRSNRAGPLFSPGTAEYHVARVIWLR